MPATSPAPQVVPPAPAPTTNPHPTTITGAVQAGPPSSFVTLVGPSHLLANLSASHAQRVGVVSTSTGQVIRYLSGDILGYAWSPDGRQVALVRGAIHDNEKVPTQLLLLDVDSGTWRVAVTFDANRGPVPYWSRLNVAWPAPRRLAFVARIAGSDKRPGKYQLVYVDRWTGKLTPSVILASDPNTSSRVEVNFLDFDASGRYLLYGTAWIRLSTWWVGGKAPVKVSQFSTFDSTSRAYSGGNW